MQTTTPHTQSGILIIDLETGGLDEQRMGLVEIGACWLHTEEVFFRECRPFEGSAIEIEALRVNGYDEQRARDPKRMGEGQAIVELFGWARGGLIQREARVQMAGWNGHFDHRHVRAAAKRAGVGENFFPIRHSLIDPQAILTAAIVRGEILVEGLDPVYLQAHPELWGGIVKGSDHASEILGLAPEQKPHNALRGALQVKAMLRKLLAPMGGLP